MLLFQCLINAAIGYSLCRQKKCLAYIDISIGCQQGVSPCVIASPGFVTFLLFISPSFDFNSFDTTTDECILLVKMSKFPKPLKDLFCLLQ